MSKILLFVLANSVDPDQMPHSVASDLGLHCLPKPICPSIWGYIGTINAKTMKSVSNFL